MKAIIKLKFIKQQEKYLIVLDNGYGNEITLSDIIDTKEEAIEIIKQWFDSRPFMIE